MRFQRLGLSLSAALMLAALPAAARAQVIVRDPCLGSSDYCFRRDNLERQMRDRALDRAARAQERSQRLTVQRQDRSLDARLRAEDRAIARSATMRDIQERARDRQDAARERALDRRDDALNRRLRIRPPFDGE
jgi:hypothetical protein